MKVKKDKEYLSHDFTAGLFIGGIVAMVLMATLDIWNRMDLAPMVFILLLDGILLIEQLVVKIIK